MQIKILMYTESSIKYIIKNIDILFSFDSLDKQRKY